MYSNNSLPFLSPATQFSFLELNTVASLSHVFSEVLCVDINVHRFFPAFFFKHKFNACLRSPALSPLGPRGAVPRAHDNVGAHETVFISLKIRRKKEMNF